MNTVAHAIHMHTQLLHMFFNMIIVRWDCLRIENVNDEIITAACRSATVVDSSTEAQWGAEGIPFSTEWDKWPVMKIKMRHIIIKPRYRHLGLFIISLVDEAISRALVDLVIECAAEEALQAPIQGSS